MKKFVILEKDVLDLRFQMQSYFDEGWEEDQHGLRCYDVNTDGKCTTWFICVMVKQSGDSTSFRKAP